MAILDEVLQTLEIQPTGIPTVVRLSQNENGRQIRLTLRGQETDFPAGCLVTISGTKPDGVVYSASGSLDGNVAIISEDTQMTAVAGMWKARVNVIYGGSTIATELIVFEVYADPVDPGSVPSESELNGLVAEAQYWAENARSSAYGSPLVAETAAEMIETDRVYVYTGSETGYTAGHWYYYNGTTWADGGIYNAAAIQTDTTLSVPGMAADAKATGDAIAGEATRATAAEGAIAADVAEAAGDIEDIQTDLTGVHGDIDALEAVVSTKADKDGNYVDLTAGTALAVLSDSYTEDAVPYKFRRTPYKSRRLMDEIVGGSVAFNQLVQNGDFSDGVQTWTGGFGTITAADGELTYRLVTKSTVFYDNQVYHFVDIPNDHVIFLHTETLAKYDAPFYMSVRTNRVGQSGVGISAVTPTPNTWSGFEKLTKTIRDATDIAIYWSMDDSRYEVGDTAKLRNCWIIDVTQMFGSTIADYIYTLEQSTAGAGVALFKSMFNADYYAYNAGELKSIEGLSAHKMRDANSNVIGNYPLDSTLTLRGVPKLVDGKIVFDGDTYASDGTVTRRYGVRAYQSGDESLIDAITDGTNTVYKLTTATTETADPYINPQYCSANGTEEYISETVVPVGHESKYYRDIDAVIPDAPTADGVYTLKCTVSGGVPSYSWEV